MLLRAGAVCGLLILMLSDQVRAECPRMTPDRLSVHRTAQQLLLRDRFTEVDSLYTEYRRRYPADPAGYLFHAGALLAEMSDAEDNGRREEFNALLDSVEVLVSRYRDSCRGRSLAWLHLFRGHVRAYRSLYEAKFGSFLKALSSGLKSRGAYHDALKADSTLYDAYFGLGSYHYWKSAKAGVLKLFGIFKNEKERGIAELHLAIDSSVLSREAARSGLLWIYLDAEQYDSVIVLARSLAAEYPGGKSFLWPLAQAYMKSGRYDSAVTVYRRLRAQLERNPGNYYNLIEVDYALARAWEKLGNREETDAAAARLQEYERYIPPATRRRQERKLAVLKRLAASP